MKKTLFIASLAALAFVAGCSDNKDTKKDGSMGVVGETKKGSCCTQKSEGGSMGVVAGEKSCEDKSHCAAGGTCPMKGKSDKQN
jgi:hypothetical protein